MVTGPILGKKSIRDPGDGRLGWGGGHLADKVKSRNVDHGEPRVEARVHGKPRIVELGVKTRA